MSDEQLLVDAFLAGYPPRTRDAYAGDLRQWRAWLAAQTPPVPLLEVTRAHVRIWAQSLADAGRAPGTVARKLASVSGFYASCVADDVIDRNPALYVRRPKVATESPRLGLDADELRRLLAAAAAAGPPEHALVCLLALNGLRVSEACGATPADLSEEGGHPVLAITRKGGKRARVPLAERTATALAALPAGDSLLGWDRFQAWRVIRRLVHAAGITKTISPHSLRHTFVTLSLVAGVPLHEVQDAAGHASADMTQRYNRARNQLEHHATYELDRMLGDDKPDCA